MHSATGALELDEIDPLPCQVRQCGPRSASTALTKLLTSRAESPTVTRRISQHRESLRWCGSGTEVWALPPVNSLGDWRAGA